MLMVIFGAGASYDSLAAYPAPALSNQELPTEKGGLIEQVRPPLANELFQLRGPFGPLIEEYREIGGAITRLRHLNGANVETVLEELRQEGTTNKRRHVELNAVRYYLRRAIGLCSEQWPKLTSGVTNYGALLHAIQDWQVRTQEPVRLVTFNYDTLLEQACPDTIGIDPLAANPHFSLALYVKDANYKVFKVHGSINWARFVPVRLQDTRRVEHQLIGLGDKLVPSGEYRMAAITDYEAGPGLFLFPAIALPLEEKLDFECPQDHVSELEDCLSSVTNLLIIGWRATDRHFLGRWSKQVPTKLDRIHIVAGGSGEAAQVQRNLEAEGIKGTYDLSDQGFTNFVTGPELRKFLA